MVENIERRFLNEVIYTNCDITSKKWTEEIDQIQSYALMALNALKEIGEGCKTPEEIITKKEKFPKRQIYRGLNIIESAGLVKMDENGNYELTETGKDYFEKLSEPDLILEIVKDVEVPLSRITEDMQKIIYQPWERKRGPIY